MATLQEVSSDSDSSSEFSGFDSDDIAVSDSEDSASDSSDDDFRPEWSDDLQEVDLQPFVRESGPTHSLAPDASERDFFSLFFPEQAVELLVNETNRYASQYQTVYGTDSRWFDVSLDEMYAFIGLLILMGLMVASQIEFYWSTNKFLGIRGFQEVMSLRRFQKILKYMHITNNMDSDDDPLYKVRPLIDVVTSTFGNNYRPKKNQSIDEGMIAYQGRFSAKQYIPSKPIKWGIKVWMRCDSLSGYCHQFDVYLGKELTPATLTSKTLSQRVVERLTEPLRGNHHHIYFDSFFTSVRLMKSLHRHGLYACGTVVKNRKGLPSTFKSLPRLQPGQYCSYQDGNMVATVWQDKRPVSVLSTNADPCKTDIANRKQRDGSVRQYTRPESVSLYQQHFRGVDLCDQLRAGYEVGRPSKKWWKYLMNFMLNLSIINSFLVKVESHREENQKRYRQITFRRRLAEQLINGFSSTRRMICNPLPTIRGGPINSADHQLTRLGRKRSTCKACVSSSPKRRRDTVYGCIRCNTHICSADCMVKFHSEE